MRAAPLPPDSAACDTVRDLVGVGRRARRFVVERLLGYRPVGARP